MSDEDKQLIFEQYPDIKDEWHEKYGDRLNQLVFIGRDYNKEKILKKLMECLAE